jgi:hypothetical protein
MNQLEGWGKDPSELLIEDQQIFDGLLKSPAPRHSGESRSPKATDVIKAGVTHL